MTRLLDATHYLKRYRIIDKETLRNIVHQNLNKVLNTSFSKTHLKLPLAKRYAILLSLYKVW